MWSANLLYRLLLDYNMKYNTVSFCLKPVSTCCIKPKPLKICSYLNINKSQNEDFQSNGGTYFLAHFCILYWKTKKVLPLCNYIDCSEGTVQRAVVQGMVKCLNWFSFFAVIDSLNQLKSYFFLHHNSVICQCLDMREKIMSVFCIKNEYVYDSYSYFYFKFMPGYEPCVIYTYVTAIDILVIL